MCIHLKYGSLHTFLFRAIMRGEWVSNFDERVVSGPLDEV